MHKPPGEEVDDEFEEKVETLDIGDEGEKEALERFCLVVLEPKKVDWSQQNVSHGSLGERGSGD